MSTSQILRLLVRYGQNYLVYPSAFEKRPRDIKIPKIDDVDFEEVRLKTSDGFTLCCYLLRQTEESPKYQRKPRENGHSDILVAGKSDHIDVLATVILFHGNAMNIGHCVYEAERLCHMRCNVLMLSYRGYGNSEGSPSEKGLGIDAQTALEFVMADSKISQVPLVLYGQSLGGAVAIDLASRNPSKVAALIVENTFMSLPRVVRDWPGIGIFSFLCHQKWNSASKIPHILPTIPILMLSGAQDEVVPQKHMRCLWDIAQRRGMRPPNVDVLPEHDEFLEFQHGEHGNTYLQPRYWRGIEKFLLSVLRTTSERDKFVNLPS